MSGTKILWDQIRTVLTIILTTTWTATQWTAWRLGFQPQLGGQTIMQERERIKRETIKQRRLLHRKAAAYANPDGPEPPLSQLARCPRTSDHGQENEMRQIHPDLWQTSAQRPSAAHADAPCRAYPPPFHAAQKETLR